MINDGRTIIEKDIMIASVKIEGKNEFTPNHKLVYKIIQHTLPVFNENKTAYCASYKFFDGNICK